MSWNDNGTLATRTDAANNTTTMSSDPLGRITSIKDPNQNETKLTYDGKDRILTMTDPYTNTTTFAYDEAGRRKSVTTPRGTTSYAYDAEGRVVSVTDPLGNVTKTAYDAAGDVLTRTDARGNTTKYEYDNAGRVTKMTDATGGVWTYGYCAGIGGSASCSSCGGGGASFCDLTDPNGNHIHQEFDSTGRVASVTDSLGHSSFTTYDKAGRKTLETDANGNATAFGYDEAGRLMSVTEASGAVTNYTYDKNGNKLTQKDANGHIWSFRYDALNRLIEEKDPLTRTTSYTYDSLGNLKTKTDGKGQVTTYTYNIRRLTNVAYPGGSDTITYDTLGRRITASNANLSLGYTYDALNRIKSITNTTYNSSVLYDYDGAGNVARQVAKGPGVFDGGTASYTYDAKNRLTTIADTQFGTFRFGYDAMDRRTSLLYPNGVTTSYAYDNAYRITAIATKSGQGDVIDAWSYQYDAVGNRLSKTDMDGKVEAYNYDNTYRLTEARYGDGSREAFTYDPAGNRMTRSDESGTTIQYSYDIANQLLRAGNDTFVYDANGSVTSKTTLRGTTNLVYDGQNRVTSISGPEGTETSVWGPDGQRVRMNNATWSYGDSKILYDLRGNAVFETGYSVYRIFGLGVDEVLAEHKATGTIRFIHHDALGSVTAATGPDGVLKYRRTYRAFGQMNGTVDADEQTPGSAAGQLSRYAFTGRELSVGAMMQYRSRYYDTAYGRLTAQDEFRGAEVRPPSLHRYVYCFDNPVRYADPSGYMVEAASLVRITGFIILLTGMKMFYDMASYAFDLLQAFAGGFPNSVVSEELTLVFAALAYFEETVLFVFAITYMLFGVWLMNLSKSDVSAMGLTYQDYEYNLGVFLAHRSTLRALGYFAVPVACLRFAQPALLGQRVRFAMRSMLCAAGLTAALR